jgi:catechol 2,3-dioxygenase-like lactoylglutathione lyase family enzyme
MERRSLVPELIASDFAASLNFYVLTLGFEVKYRRETPSFAYLEREGSQIMIEERHRHSWVLGELLHPFGRGLHLQIQCTDVAALRAKVASAGINVYRELEDAWYQAGGTRVGQRQFVVPDPDGYLLRFCQMLGERSRGG